jgi:hypothetical protein
MKANQAVEPTGASRLCQCAVAAPWRLAPAAHRHRSTNAHLHRAGRSHLLQPLCFATGLEEVAAPYLHFNSTPAR